jgi:hypothetical protein
VFGKAVAPRGVAVREMTVALLVGDALRELRVTGDRRWQPARGLDLARAAEESRAGKHDAEALVPGRAEPLLELPLTWQRAFGGAAALEEGALPWAWNPLGVGYQHLLEHAVQGPLPNLEDPRRPMAHWRDWIDAVCFAALPRAFRTRVDRGVALTEDCADFELLPGMCLTAPPEQCFAELPPGTRLEVRGMRAGGPIAMRVPDLEVEASVRVGADELELPCRLDTVELWPSDRRVCFVLRAGFRYRFRGGERRSATLRLARLSGIS